MRKSAGIEPKTLRSIQQRLNHSAKSVHTKSIGIWCIYIIIQNSEKNTKYPYFFQGSWIAQWQRSMHIDSGCLSSNLVMVYILTEYNQIHIKYKPKLFHFYIT